MMKMTTTTISKMWLHNRGVKRLTAPYIYNGVADLNLPLKKVKLTRFRWWDSGLF